MLTGKRNQHESGQDLQARCSEHCNETSGSIKWVKFIFHWQAVSFSWRSLVYGVRYEYLRADDKHSVYFASDH
jgi:hypothetical protein